MTTDAPLIFVIAGEPSGDILGERLMAALTAETAGRIRFAGIGGERMAALGLESQFPMSDLTLFGAAEVLPKAPLIFRRVRETVAAIEALRPAAVLTIDVPGFSFRVQQRLSALAIPRIHFVAPTVWAYRPGRAAHIAKFLTHLLVLLPFEPPYFERVGLPCTYVGHPVVESAAGEGDGPGFRARHGIDVRAPLLVLLPGSRPSEVRRLLPIFAEVLRRLAPRLADLQVVVPTLAGVAARVEAAVADWPGSVRVLHGEAEKFDAFAAGNVALAASGTVALELAMARLPSVVTYRVNPLSAIWLRWQIRTNYANLVNLVLDRPAVPELMQAACRPDRLAAEVVRLFDDADARNKQMAAADEAMRSLGQDGPPPSVRAARAVLGAAGLAAGRTA